MKVFVKDGKKSPPGILAGDLQCPRSEWLVVTS